MNRRMGGGGGGGPRGGNRSAFSQQPFQTGGGGGLNPWQGGSSNPNPGGLFSQITSNPQLALALTSLLQPQQQQPPSLLSLNTSAAFPNNNHNNNNNRNFGGGNNGGRFNNGIQRGRDFRRHEPYNKNRLNFIPNRRKPSPKRERKVEDKKKQPPKKEENEPLEDGADEEKKETKRDWKDEKNQGEGKESGDEAEVKKEGDSKEGKYVGVPSKYFNCFVCNKQMWDGESMGKHVRGRAHHEMLKALEESIHICVNILRENLRLAEERKMIEYNRQSRQRKFNQRREPPLSHCAMCDLKFMGKIISHRRTDGHQRLKRYLHPTCRICDKEYPSRIEWIEHCFTPEHLKRVAEVTENRTGGKDGDEVTSGDGDFDSDHRPNLDLDLEPLLEESLHLEADDPILEMDGSLDNMMTRLPAYKRDRPLASSSLKEFSGWRCDLCNRSFADKDDADAHLKTKRHFYQFIDYIKDRFDREEKRKKAEKEAEKKSQEEKEEAEKERSAEDVKQEDVKAEDQDEEMYDPAHVSEFNGEEEEEEEENIKMEAETEAEAEPECEPEIEKKELVVEVKKEVASPVVTRPNTRKLVGPKSKRGRK